MAVDLQTRQLRYFVALAEDLHFTRAAERLFVTQQTLSSQIRQLEERVGCRLIHRTTRRAHLTRAGEVFVGQAREALALLDGAVEEARGADRSENATISLGFMVSAALELTAPILAEFAKRYPQVNVDLHEFDYADPSVGLLSGQVDIGFVRPPIEGPELRYEQLIVEPRVLCVSSSHRFAQRDCITVAEVLGVAEPMIAPRCPDAAWTGFWMLDEQRDGPRTNVAFHTGTLLEELEAISLGKPCVMVTAMAVARYAPRPGVSFVPIADLSPTVISIGWRPERETELVRAFIDVALDVRDCEEELLARIERVSANP
jgi:DNA-binding transcriptional LysR family regulator